MSLETWKEEFYPVPAEVYHDEDDELVLINHAIQKWTGLLTESMQKHSVGFRDDMRCAISDLPLAYSDAALENVFDIDSTTCALCQRHSHCQTCPVDTFSIGCNESKSPYDKFVIGNDPLPMLQALKEVRTIIREYRNGTS